MPRKTAKEATAENTPAAPIVSDVKTENDSPPPVYPEASDQYRTTYEKQESAELAMEARHARQDEANIITNFVIASKNGNILEAEVAGVHVEGDNISWVCYYGPVTVHIPFEETFDNLPKELLDSQATNLAMRRRQFLQKSINIKIPFVVTSFQADPTDNSYTTIGSRVKAIKRIRRRYFGENSHNPVKVGDTVNAQVLNVGKSALWLYFCGIDVRVENRQITHRYMPNLEENFVPGDKVRIQISSVATDPATGEPSVTVSGRPVELEDAKKRHFRIRKGNIYAATIITIRSEPSMKVSLWLEGVDVPGYAATKDIKGFDLVHTGDKVYVEVLGITESGYVHTKIMPRRAGRA